MQTELKANHTYINFSNNIFVHLQGSDLTLVKVPNQIIKRERNKLPCLSVGGENVSKISSPPIYSERKNQGRLQREYRK